MNLGVNLDTTELFSFKVTVSFAGNSPLKFQTKHFQNAHLEL